MRRLVAALLGLCLLAVAGTAVAWGGRGGGGAGASAPGEGPGAEAQLKKMLAAFQSGSYEEFLSDGEEPFRAALKQTTFDAVSSQIAPRLKGGYTLTYLGTLNQVGYAVNLWKITFKDGKDDVLAKISTKGGKVGGIFLQ